MTQPHVTTAALFAFSAAMTLLVFAINNLARKIKNPMSDAAFQKLSADVQALTAENATLKSASAAKDAQIADLQTQLAAAQAAAGTSDADVEALDAQVEAALNPPAPAPVAPPDPSTPPATA